MTGHIFLLKLTTGWSCHAEGASCIVHLPSQHTLVSGGRNGQVCLWDLRQRQLRQSFAAFEHSTTVRALSYDAQQQLLIAGSADGALKMWWMNNGGTTPPLVYALPGEHASRSGGFTALRQIGAGSGASVQGVQQLYVDGQRRLFSCGADCSLKLRPLPIVMHETI